MSSSDVLTHTLQAVINIKLTQLEKQKSTYENSKRSLLNKVEHEEDNKARARMLIDGAAQLPAMMKPLEYDQNLSVTNIRSFIEQAECDPSVSSTLLSSYENAIRNHLDAQSNKYDFATLYAQLVKDWTSASRENATGSEEGVEFVTIGREEMGQQRATWEEYVFNAKETDVSAIKTYLDELFAENTAEQVTKAFEELRKEFQIFQLAWDDVPVHFNKHVVSGCINSILSTEAISDKKRSILNEFLGNDIALSEIADVLNMRMSSRGDFAWEGVTIVEQRRDLNGRYRFYPDEDLLQKIFLEYIGMKWATELRRILVEFAKKGGVFKPAMGKLSKQAFRRRRFFLGDESAKISHNVESEITDHWRTKIFLDQLPSEMFEQRNPYSDGKSEGESGDSRESPVAVVQELIHRVQSSIIMRQRLGQDTTVIRSDFRWFGPSLPHSSIFAVLKYFGVDDDWLEFFVKVLEAPMAVRNENGVGETRVRKRGTPISTSIGTFMGEALLFCSDFAVNQQANGSRLYRLHDDLWLWGDVETCSQSWTALTKFAEIMGLAFNEQKTGSCVILRDGSREDNMTASPETASLPQGDVTWGFLKLASDSGRFVIDQDKVNLHIDELQLQLNACKSVFDFVQAWNLYAVRFFRTNCGKAAGCFGRQHIDSMLKTFKQVQSRVFASSSGSVGQHLKNMIEEKFGVNGIPDGFLYYPTSMGGLGLQNPFVELYSIRNKMDDDEDAPNDPQGLVDKFFQHEKARYNAHQSGFESLHQDPDDGVGNKAEWAAVEPFDWDNITTAPSEGVVEPYVQPPGDWADLYDEPFMSFDEFTQHREITSHALASLYHRLLAVPSERYFGFHGQVLRRLPKKGGNIETEYGLTPCEQWIVQLYSSEIVSRFGSLHIVEEGSLPIGLMKMMTQSRFNWQN